VESEAVRLVERLSPSFANRPWSFLGERVSDDAWEGEGQARRQREAISEALVAQCYLCYTRRRIPLPISPNDWQTMINNSGVLQVFGLTNHLMAKEWGEVMGVDAPDLIGLTREESGLFVGGEFSRCRRPDYLNDRVFRGQYNDNPRFALVNQEESALAV
jgi:hypothetical protein